ncbi:LuxR C-terminal-related transcriptional regulator [Buttiauxella selenatireducens]|uniref:LuxR C-terminal-related transcriptional regulator n=1 Tax=Buttiauxella selenatireducens TaxID=3073902 RepID=A0ABY9SCV1_9ENTR|nr:LuxR C-terminal-related transcriptional regulator [Buttiauxella sp. R73]WMY75319.1 LuxR C-terminal-related transcriptional regulator [Buttiauxella sp. R73]
MKSIIVWSAMDFMGAGLHSAITESGLEPVFVSTTAELEFVLEADPTVPLLISLLDSSYSPTEKILWLNHHVEDVKGKQIALLLKHQHKSLIPELLLQHVQMVADNARLAQLHLTLLQMVMNPGIVSSRSRERGKLTQMEKSILRLLLEGSDIRHVSQQLAINYKTAQCHKMNAVRKLGFRNSAQLYQNLSGFRSFIF